MNSRGFCPRCRLARESGGDALAALLDQWIAAIPPERRADDALYRDRLERCDACPRLSGGLCGCYVEYRAAQGRQRCPDSPARW